MSTSTKIEMNSTKPDGEKDIENNNPDKPYKPGGVVIFITEVLGTAMLLFLGCMGVCVPVIVDVPVVPHFGGFAFGLTVLIVIQSLGHISGAHLNPQVTIAAVILGKISVWLAPVYFLAEFVGAILGFGLLKWITPDRYAKSMCDTMPYKELTPVQALVIEIAITCTLILVCGGVWDSRNKDKEDSTPIRFGFVIVGLSIIAGPLTAASMNTARSFAPALINGNWEHHWIYWVGPTVGALIGAFFYKYVLSAPKK